MNSIIVNKANRESDLQFHEYLALSIQPFNKFIFKKLTAIVHCYCQTQGSSVCTVTGPSKPDGTNGDCGLYGSCVLKV